MIIYEVNLEVDESIKFKYAGWLPSHIEKMMTVPGFMNAYWFFREPQFEGKDASKTLWTIQYFIKDQESLDQYLNGKAKEMRQEALDLFGTEHFKADRRVLYPLAGAGEVNT